MPMPKASDLALMKASDLATPKTNYAGVKSENILKLFVSPPEHLMQC